jgi:hypothetical protein
MCPLALTLHPAGPDLWEARLGLAVVCRSSKPIQAAAEILLAAGHHPMSQLAVTYAGSATVIHRSFLQSAAAAPEADDSAHPVQDRPSKVGASVTEGRWEGLR